MFFRNANEKLDLKYGNRTEHLLVKDEVKGEKNQGFH